MSRLFVPFLLLVVFTGCSDPVRVPSDDGLYEVYLEGVNVVLRIDFNDEAGPKITVANGNNGPIGFRLSVYEREDAIVFQDLYIGGQDTASGVNSFLDSNRDAHLWVDIYVYNNTVASWIYWAIYHLPDTWEDWLTNTIGQDWLLNHYYTDIYLSNE